MNESRELRPTLMDNRRPGERLGRYQLVGSLATGGMAQILLAKLFGPSGFERAVVIKRMLPHIAEDQTLVRMFLDEARLLARLRHRNVVQVHELGESDGDVFLVMQYLEGESVSGLVRRLMSRGLRLPLPLALHIVAEACAGLHAAHELRDEGGIPIGVVHRDVSPQNIFVGYDGQVTLLDFGIAQARDRAAKTEPGQLKGKFAYMSPEQCMGKEVDRRSDVFSMAIVLFELATGRRLFARANALLTLEAIRDRSIPKPSSLEPSVPRALDQLCQHALERSRRSRCPTAEELRVGILAVQRTLDGPTALDSALAALMHDAFDDRIAEKHRMLQAVRAGELPEHVPSAEVDIEVIVPTVVGQLAEATTETPRLPAPARRASRRWRSVALALLVVVATLTGVALALSPLGGSEVPDERRVPQAAVAIGPSTVSDARGANERPVAAADVPTRRAGSTTPVRPASVEAAGDSMTAPEEVVLHVAGRPSGARVIVAGVDRGALPLALPWPRADVSVEVRVEAPRYRTHREVVRPDRDRTISVELVRGRRRREPERSRPDMSAPRTDGVERW